MHDVYETGYVADAGRPQVVQNFQSSSNSVPHAMQFTIVRFCPQCGQKVTRRPAGSAPLQ